MKLLTRFEKGLKNFISKRGLSTDEENYLFLLLFFTEVFGGAMHLLLFSFFAIADILSFAAVNVISVSCYAYCCYLTYRRHYVCSTMLATTEVCIYVVTTELFFGIRNGVILFFILIMEMQIIIPYTKKSLSRVLMGIFIIAMNVFVVVLDICSDPYFVMAKGAETVLMVLCLEMTFVGTIVLLTIGNYINRFILDYNLELQQEFKIEATIDPLTGLQNRRGASELEKNVEQTTENWMMAMLDIDDFKAINDTYGHQTGDLVLKKVADLISENIRRSDAAFRWGGEEFLICLRDVDEQQTFQILEKIRTCIEKAVIKTQQHEVRVTVTMGVAPYIRDDYAGSIEMSDKRLYQGKHEGKNRVIMPEVGHG